MGFIDKYLPFLLDDASANTPKRSHNDIEKEMETKTIAERTDLASARRADPDVLEVLADDHDIGVRRAVADNKANHGRTNLKLAHDSDDDVRLILANRLTKLLPHLTVDEQSEIYSMTVKALGILAEDKVTNIRVALSSSLKDVAKTPPKIARKLAEDIERDVSGPILRFGICLPDDILLDIIKAQPLGWKVNTIAQRKRLSGPITESIINSDNIAAATTVINNDGADIPKNVAQYIVEQARTIPEWDQAMVKRGTLPRKVKRKFSIMIDNSVRKFLKKNANLDRATTRDVIDTTRRRIDWIEEGRDDEPPLEKVKRLAKTKQLNEESLLDAISWSEHEFVQIALAFMARIHPDIAKKMLEMGSAKATVSLCWRAGVTMRTAIKIQQQIAKVPHNKVLLARGGEDYPLSEQDMIWQLEFFGVEDDKSTPQ